MNAMKKYFLADNIFYHFGKSDATTNQKKKIYLLQISYYHGFFKEKQI